jgi:hypothetical protein
MSVENSLIECFEEFSLWNYHDLTLYCCLQVLALKGSYHGDTLGALEAQAPSAYTGFLQQPWYVESKSSLQ